MSVSPTATLRQGWGVGLDTIKMWDASRLRPKVACLPGLEHGLMYGSSSSDARTSSAASPRRPPGALEVLALVAVPGIKVVVEPHLHEG